MSNPLLTPAMMKRVREIGERTLTQTFTHLIRDYEDGDYEDRVEIFIDGGDYVGRIRMMNQPDLGGGIGLISAVGNFRLHLPHTVELNEGDMVADPNGNLYVINDVNTEDTVRVFTTAMVQKLQ